MVWLGITKDEVTLLSVWHLLMDLLACLFDIIMLLDGTQFWEYGYIFAFCVIVPMFLDVVSFLSIVLKSQLVDLYPKKTKRS